MKTGTETQTEVQKHKREAHRRALHHARVRCTHHAAGGPHTRVVQDERLEVDGGAQVRPQSLGTVWVHSVVTAMT